MKKRIIVTSNCKIPTLKGIVGPILTPIKVDVKDIFIMMTKNVKVREVLPNGKEIPLTFDNYDDDNTKK